MWQLSDGVDTSVMSVADESFYSCVHNANHAFHRLRWLCDAIIIARSLSPEDRIRVRKLAIRHEQTGQLVAVSMAARELSGQSLNLERTDFPTPRLWCRLAPRHTRRMVERVEGNTSTFLEKTG